MGEHNDEVTAPGLLMLGKRRGAAEGGRKGGGGDSGKSGTLLPPL